MASQDGSSIREIAEQLENLSKLFDRPEQGFLAKYGRPLGTFIIAVLTIALPLIIDYANYGRSLEYKITGPVAVDSKIAVQIVLVNAGKQREKHIEIFLPADFPKAPKIESTHPLEVSSTADQTVLKIADLNGRTSLPIAILAEGALNVDSQAWQRLKISTENTIARFDAGTATDCGWQTFLVLFIYLLLLIYIGLDAAATRARAKWSALFKSEVEEHLSNLLNTAHEAQELLEKLKARIDHAEASTEEARSLNREVGLQTAEARSLYRELASQYEEWISKNTRCTTLIDEVRDMLESLRWAYRNREDQEQIKRCISRIDSGLRERLSQLKTPGESEVIIDGSNS